MDDKKLMAGLAAVLTTVAELDTETAPIPMPQGVAYAAMMAAGYELEDFMFITSALHNLGAVVVDNGAHTISITAKGKEMAAKIDAAMAAVKATPA